MAWPHGWAIVVLLVATLAGGLDAAGGMAEAGAAGAPALAFNATWTIPRTIQDLMPAGEKVTVLRHGLLRPPCAAVAVRVTGVLADTWIRLYNASVLVNGTLAGRMEEMDGDDARGRDGGATMCKPATVCRPHVAWTLPATAATVALHPVPAAPTGVDILALRLAGIPGMCALQPAQITVMAEALCLGRDPAPCPPGTFYRTGERVCRLCPAGTSSGQADTEGACAPCGPGTFSTQEGATRCTPCPAGSYCPGDVNTVPRACEAGTWSNATEAVSEAVCQACPSMLVATALRSSPGACIANESVLYPARRNGEVRMEQIWTYNGVPERAVSVFTPLRELLAFERNGEVWATMDAGRTMTMRCPRGPWADWARPPTSQPFELAGALALPDGRLAAYMVADDVSKTTLRRAVWVSADAGASWAPLVENQTEVPSQWLVQSVPRGAVGVGQIVPLVPLPLADGGLLLLDVYQPRNLSVRLPPGCTPSACNVRWGPAAGVGEAPWSRRIGARGASLPSGALLLVGGRSASEGGAVGGTGSALGDVWRSDDAGATWQLLAPRAQWPPGVPVFLGADSGLVKMVGIIADPPSGVEVGLDAVYHSRDEGQTWEAVPLPQAQDLRSISMRHSGSDRIGVLRAMTFLRADETATSASYAQLAVVDGNAVVEELSTTPLNPGLGVSRQGMVPTPQLPGLMGHAVVSLRRGSLAVLGGVELGSSESGESQVWESIPGAPGLFQAQAVSAPFPPRTWHAAVALPPTETGQAVLVMGGTAEVVTNHAITSSLSDVWIVHRSEGDGWGNSFTEQTAHAGWQPRTGLAAVVLPLSGRVCIVGGLLGTGYSAAGAYANDFWCSSDRGRTWSPESCPAPFSPRAFVGATALTQGEGDGARDAVIVAGGGTIGGNGFDAFADAFLWKDGVGWEQLWPVPWRARANMMLLWVPPAPSPRREGWVLLAGGVGGPTGDEDMHDVWGMSTQNMGYWRQLQAQAPWTPRFCLDCAVHVASCTVGAAYCDAEQGAVCFVGGSGKLGSNKSSHTALLRDSWCASASSEQLEPLQHVSARQWTQVQAPALVWSPRSNFAAVRARSGQFVVAGGRSSSTVLGDVVASGDGRSWTVRAEVAAWTARESPAMVALQSGTLLLVGGVGSSGVATNDAYISTDEGRTWQQQTGHALQAALVGGALVDDPEAGRVTLLGGLDLESNQVTATAWATYDTGRHWTAERADAGFPPPAFARVVRYTNATGATTWVLAGGLTVLEGSFQALSDVWRSADGLAWTQVAATGQNEQLLGHTLTYVPALDALLLLGNCPTICLVGEDVDLGSFSCSTSAYAQLSTDDGNSWRDIDLGLDEAQVPYRAFHATLVDSDSSVLFMGGMNVELNAGTRGDCGDPLLNDVTRIDLRARLGQGASAAADAAVSGASGGHEGAVHPLIRVSEPTRNDARGALGARATPLASSATGVTGVSARVSPLLPFVPWTGLHAPLLLQTGGSELLLLGGARQEGALTETSAVVYGWRAGEAELSVRAVAPWPARVEATAVVSHALGRVFVLGGLSQTREPLVDGYSASLDGTQWRPMAMQGFPPNAMPPLIGRSLAAAANGSLLLFGGHGTDSDYTRPWISNDGGDRWKMVPVMVSRMKSPMLAILGRSAFLLAAGRPMASAGGGQTRPGSMVVANLLGNAVPHIVEMYPLPGPWSSVNATGGEMQRQVPFITPTGTVCVMTYRMPKFTSTVAAGPPAVKCAQSVADAYDTVAFSSASMFPDEAHRPAQVSAPPAIGPGQGMVAHTERALWKLFAGAAIHEPSGDQPLHRGRHTLVQWRPAGTVVGLTVLDHYGVPLSPPVPPQNVSVQSPQRGLWLVPADWPVAVSEDVRLQVAFANGDVALSQVQRVRDAIEVQPAGPDTAVADNSSDHCVYVEGSGLTTSVSLFYVPPKSATVRTEESTKDTGGLVLLAAFLPVGEVACGVFLPFEAPAGEVELLLRSNQDPASTATATWQVGCASGYVRIAHVPRWGQAGCVPCPAGTVMPDALASNLSSCEPCAPGTFGPDAGARSFNACTPCPAGTYQPQAGVAASTACLSCPRGTFSAQVGAVAPGACSNCPPGTWAAAAGLASNDSCAPCPAGTAQALPGATSQEACRVCPVGKISGRAGSAWCSLCPAGTYTNQAGASRCAACPRGKYSASPGAKSVLACQECAATGQTTLGPGADSPAGCVCPAGTVLKGDACTSCSKGQNCSHPGESVASMPVMRGYWRAGRQSDHVYPCNPLDACSGGHAADAVLGLRSSALCAPGYEAPLCSQCAPGYGRTESTGHCERCTAQAKRNAALFIGGGAAVVVALGLALWAFWRWLRRDSATAATESRVEAEEVASVSDDDSTVGRSRVLGALPSKATLVQHRAEVAATSMHLWASARPKVKHVAAFFQIAAIVGSTYGVNWSAGGRATARHFALANLDLVRVAPLGCLLPLTFADRVVLASVAPLVVLAALWLLPAAASATARIRGGWLREAWGSLRLRARQWQATGVLAFIVQPSVTAWLFSTYQCTVLDVGDGETEAVLSHDMRHLCSDAMPQRLRAFAGVMLVVYVCGPVALATYQLRRHAAPLRAAAKAAARGQRPPTGTELALAEAGFLASGYRAGWLGMEVVETVRKTVLAGVITLVHTRHGGDGGDAMRTQTQCLMGMVISVAFLAAYARMCPMQRVTDNAVLVAAQATLSLVFFAGLMLSVESDAAGAGGRVAGLSRGDYSAALPVSGVLLALAGVGAVAVDVRARRSRQGSSVGTDADVWGPANAAGSCGGNELARMGGGAAHQEEETSPGAFYVAMESGEDSRP